MTDKNTIRVLKKEIEILKQRNYDQELENDKLQKRIDDMLEEKNDSIFKNSKEIEREKKEKRELRIESEKQYMRNQSLQETLTSLKKRYEEKIREIEKFNSERLDFLNEIEKKDKQLQFLQHNNKVLEEENLKLQSTQLQAATQTFNEEHEKILREKQANSVLQSEFDSLKRRFEDLYQDYNTLNLELKATQNEKTDLELEVSNIKKKERSVDGANRNYLRTLEHKESYIKELETEIEGMRTKIRELYDKKPFGEENPERDSSVLEKKNKALKEKLAKANQKIMELLKQKALFAFENQETKKTNVKDDNFQYLPPPPHLQWHPL